MKRVIWSFFLCCGMAQGEPLKASWESHQVQAVLEVVDTKHGIDATEARALAEAYFRYTEGFDGALWSMKRDKNVWRFETAVGQGTAGADILIDCESGLIRKTGSPDVAFPYKKLRDWFRSLTESVNGNKTEQPPVIPESKPE